MKTTKLCPQCQTAFIGRSNKIYCGDSCKIEAFQKRHLLEVTDSISLSRNNNTKDKKLKVLSKKQLQAEIELRKYQLELEHKEKMIELEERRRMQALKEQEIAIAKDKEERDAKLKAQAEAFAKAWNPIKDEINDSLQEVIDKGEENKWKINDLEDFIESLGETIKRLRNFTSENYDDFLDSIVYSALKRLLIELKSALRDQNCYINESKLAVNFKRSYIRELERLRQQVSSR